MFKIFSHTKFLNPALNDVTLESQVCMNAILVSQTAEQCKTQIVFPLVEWYSHFHENPSTGWRVIMLESQTQAWSKDDKETER
jgi:hypothetical protein